MESKTVTVPPVPDEHYQAFLKTFQDFQNPAALTNSPLMTRPLVQEALTQNSEQLPHLVLKAVFTEILTLLQAENPEQADLLQGRFWEGLQIEEMVRTARPQVMSKRTFSNYQRNAIQAFAFLFLQTEARGRVSSAAGPSTEHTAVPAAPDVATSPDAPSRPLSGPLTSPRLWSMPPLVVAGIALFGLLVAAVIMLLMRIDSTTATLLFADDFEQGADRWRTDSAAWSIRQEADGNYVYCVESTGEYTYALTGSTTWRDYEWELDLKIVESAPLGSGNLLWRVDDDFYPYYLLDFFAERVGGAVLAKEVPDYTTLDQSLRALPEGAWLHLRIAVTGDEMALYYGQEAMPLLTARDAAPIAHGAIGMGAGFPAGNHDGRWIICFDNITVHTGAAE